MAIDRRQMIRGIGIAICAGSVPAFVPALIPKLSIVEWADEHRRLSRERDYFDGMASVWGLARVPGETDKELKTRTLLVTMGERNGI